MLVREFLELLDRDIGVEIHKPLYDEHGSLEKYEPWQKYSWEQINEIPFTVLNRKVAYVSARTYATGLGTRGAILILATVKGEAE